MPTKKQQKQFSRARDKLLKTYEGVVSLALRDLADGARIGISKNSVRKLFDTRISNNSPHFGARLRRLMIEYDQPYSSDPAHYHFLAGQVGIKDKEQSCLDSYLGLYYYFRKYPSSNTPTKGVIEIRKANGIYVFYHWPETVATSREGPPSKKAKHAGYVLVINNCIHMLGAKDGYVRLGVCRRSVLDQPENHILKGVVLTLTGESRIFSARFVMIHQSNEHLFTLCSEPNAIEMLLDHLQSPVDVIKLLTNDHRDDGILSIVDDPG